MKTILIVGPNSYIGKKMFNYFSCEKAKYHVESITLRNNLWKENNLSKYDHIIYVVGLAHLKENEKNKENYYKVNYELTKEFADECKRQNVKNIIYFSTMSVFGNARGEINENTPILPISHYGKSKALAENYLIEKFEKLNTKVQIIRPPMVYGYNSPGNYSLLSKVVKKIKLFPMYENKRSMIDINNLCFFVEELINSNLNDIYYHPQNSYYTNTSLMVKEIADLNGKKIILVKVNKKIMNILFFFTTIRKLFDDLYYSTEFSFLNNRISYDELTFEESIAKSENIKS